MTKKKRSSNPLAPIFAAPDDDELRRVIGDQLLEQNDPRGELIALQFAKPVPKKRISEIINKHLAALIGPIFHVAHKKSVVFDKGFLSSLEVDRRLVPRADWEKAAKAEEWATVKDVRISILTTPAWWLTEWMKNPATKNLQRIDVSNALVLERHDNAWRIVRTTPRKTYTNLLAALMKGMSADERARVHLGPKIPKNHRELFDEAIANAKLG